MKVEYINPFISATTNVFDTMVGTELHRGVPSLKDGYQPSHEVSAVIGLSGKAKGTVVLSVDREVAIQVAAALLQEQPAGLNADVADAMGEMANMIAGQAKAQLEHLCHEPEPADRRDRQGPLHRLSPQCNADLHSVQLRMGIAGPGSGPGRRFRFDCGSPPRVMAAQTV